MPKIITEHDPLYFDPGSRWIAYYEDDLGETMKGSGSTEEAAIARLKELYPRDGED